MNLKVQLIVDVNFLKFMTSSKMSCGVDPNGKVTE